MIQIYNKIPQAPVDLPRIRTNGDMPDSDVLRAYQKLDAARHSMSMRLRHKPNRNRFAFPQPAFTDLLGTLTVAGSNFASFTTAKTVLPTNALCVLPPGYWTIGRILEVDVWGLLANLVTTPGTVTFQIMLGAIVVFTSGAIQLNATAHTANPFWFKALLTVRTVGSGTSAAFMGQSWVIGAMFTKTATTVDADRGVNVGFSAGAETTDAAIMGPETTPTVGTGFDSTAASTLDFWVGFSINNAANNVTVQGYCAKSIA
jgi:hypothetical protein